MNDDDLRRRFRSLRQAESAAAGDYRRPVRETRGRRAWPGLVAGAALAGVAAWLVLPLVRSAPDAPETGTGPVGWAMPTDVLLDLPGHELLSTPPRIGDPWPDLPLDPSAPRALPRHSRRTLA